MKKTIYLSIIFLILLITIFLIFFAGFIKISDKRIFYIGSKEKALKEFFEKEKYEIINDYKNKYKDDYLYYFVKDIVQSDYPYLNLKEKKYDFDWKDLSDFYIDKIKNTDNEDKKMYLLNEMISFLNDSNIKIDSNHDNFYNLTLPIKLKEFGNDIKIETYNIHAIEFQDNIQIGDTLLKIDDIPIDEIIQEISSKTYYGKVKNGKDLILKKIFNLYNFYIKDEKYDSSTLTLKDSEQNEYTISQKYNPNDIYFKNNSFMINEYAYNSTKNNFEIFDKDIGYLKIGSFEDENFEKFIQNIELERTKGLIIDIRGNSEKSNEKNMFLLLSKFMNTNDEFLYKRIKNSEFLHIFGRNSNDYPNYIEFNGEFYPDIKLNYEPSNNKYDNPVILIIDNINYNSSDLFIYYFKNNSIGKVIGRNTIMNIGKTFDIKFDDIILKFPYLMYLNHYKEILEEYEIKPDIYIPYTDNEVRGEDIIYETSFNLILASIEQK